MAHKSPIGLLIIRDPKGKTVTSGAFQFYQNAVDYLSQYAQARNWTKTGTDTYKTPTGHILQVVMMIPDGIDLTKETYLEEKVSAPDERVSS